MITDGYFDAGRVLDEGIDPSGLVKGWAVDRAGDVLDAAGARNYSLNAGGDLRLRGAPLPEPRWRVGIQHPLVRDKIAAVVEGNDVAVATSGAYARGEHVVDPHTGRPITHNTVTVSARHADCAHADAWAAALNVLGVQEGLPLAERLNLAAQFVVEQTNGKLEVRQSTEWKAREAVAGAVSADKP